MTAAAFPIPSVTPLVLIAASAIVVVAVGGIGLFAQRPAVAIFGHVASRGVAVVAALGLLLAVPAYRRPFADFEANLIAPARLVIQISDLVPRYGLVAAPAATLLLAADVLLYSWLRRVPRGQAAARFCSGAVTLALAGGLLGAAAGLFTQVMLLIEGLS